MPTSSSILTVRTGPLILGGLVLAALWTFGSAQNPGAPGFPLDDAWIHMVYGRGLLQDGYLAYNDGVPTTGSTSPLWAIVLAAVHAVAGRDPDRLVFAVQGVGALLHLAGIAGAVSLGRRLSGRETTGAAAGVLVALATPVAAASYSGMEVALTGTLLLLAVDAAAAAAWRRSGILLALAFLARPEAAAVAAVVAGYAALSTGAAAGAGGAARADAADGAPRAQFSRAGRLAAVLLPGIIAAGALAAHHLWASGSALPATFHAKSQSDLAALPARLGAALRDFLSQVPPLAAGLGWLALAGYAPAARTGGPRFLRLVLPLAAGAAFLLANLYVVDPVDPAAFYHLRYLLPAVPLLLVALALGADALGRALPVRRAEWQRLPLALLGVLAAVGALRTAAPVSRHFHNDVRNINEVQRALGLQLAADLAPDARIAVSDAGALRYFSGLECLDVLGLNTPEMLHADDAFLAAHPVEAIVLLPAWFRPVDATGLATRYAAATENYTVTGNPAMGRQVVLTLTPEAAAAGGSRRVGFVGFRAFSVDLVAPGQSRAGDPASDRSS